MPLKSCGRCEFAGCRQCAASKSRGFSAGMAWFSDSDIPGLNGLSTPRYMGEWCTCCLSQVKARLISNGKVVTVERLTTLALRPDKWHDDQSSEFKGLSQAVLDCGLAQYWRDKHTPGHPMTSSRNGNWGWPFETDQTVAPCKRRMIGEIATIWLSLP